jgi:ribosomal-protein-alanine N-acetyltransferase
MFPELTTQRFILKQVLPADQQFLFEGLSDPVETPYYGVYYQSFEATKTQLDWYEKNYNDGSGIHWKIVEKNSAKNVGVISVYYYKPEHKKAEAGFWLLPQFRNKGITSEVLKPVIQYWQQEKELHRLEAFVEEENTASSKLLEKAGFVYEGTMKDCEIKFGKYISLRIYALVATGK